MTDELAVVLNGQLAGTLQREGRTRRLRFDYADDYRTRGRTPLGVLMPLQESTYSGPIVSAFIEGLLPENPATRERWTSTFDDIDPADSLGILGEMGWDAPGAVQFSTPDRVDEMLARADETVPVTDSDIGARLAAFRENDEASWTMKDEHWSLAGNQSKFALTKLSTGWHEAHGSAATTHIFKPGIGRLRHHALIEHATMRAAQTLGLDIAHSEFLRFGDGEPAIVIERYDRVVLPDDSVLRIHQEDFCSATGRLPSKKYESRGGPSLADMVGALRTTRDRHTDTRALGDFLAFNYVAGAPDGHSKNISMLLTAEGTDVAPLYDLASGLAYVGSLDRKVAVAIGGQVVYGLVQKSNWDRAASTLGIPADEYRQRVLALADGYPDAFSDALAHINDPAAEEVRTRSIDSISEHTNMVKKSLGVSERSG